MNKLLLLVCAVLAALPVQAQLPDFYKNVYRMAWVVKDADATATTWAKLGMSEIERHGEVTLPVEYRGASTLTRARWVSGRLGAVLVDLYQPVQGTTAWSEFLGRHGEGVMSLLYFAPSPEAYKQEAERLHSAGVRVLQRGTVAYKARTLNYTYFDTAPDGKYVLGLIYDTQPAPERMIGGSISPIRVSQFAFVVADLAPVSAYWKQLGFPEFSLTHPTLTHLFYRGQPAKYEQDLGWQRHGGVPFEWCVPPAGSPTVYEQYLKKHGPGVQHIAFEVPDMDQAMAKYKALGFEVAQGGGWGEDGKPGSGRFAYVDTDAAGGLTIELLWNYKE